MGVCTLWIPSCSALLLLHTSIWCASFGSHRGLSYISVELPMGVCLGQVDFNLKFYKIKDLQNGGLLLLNIIDYYFFTNRFVITKPLLENLAKYIPEVRLDMSKDILLLTVERERTNCPVVE